MLAVLKKVLIPILVRLGLKDWRSYCRYQRKIKKCIKKGQRLVACRSMKLHAGYNSEIIFIHIPKTAGLAVAKSLYGSTASHHAMARDYIAEDAARYKQAFSFTIVRNPYTRLYSAYNYLQNGGMCMVDHVWRDMFLKDYLSFEGFVLNGGLKKAIALKADHFIPQHEFVFDANGNLQCDHLGYIEDMQDIERVLSDRVGRDIQISKVNVTQSSEINIEEVYSDQMIEIVNELYKKDFLLLGYDHLSRNQKI